MSRIFTILIALILVANITFAENLTPDQEKRIQELEKISKQQEELIQKLQNRLGNMETEAPTKEYTEKIVKEYLKKPATQDTGLTAGYEDGFYIKGADGNLEMKFNGYMQMGLAIFENDTIETNSFYPNGVVMSVDVTVMEQFRGRIEVDWAQVVQLGNKNWDNDNDPVTPNSDANGLFVENGNPVEPRLLDAYLEYVPMEEFGIRVGQTHVPFSMEGQYTATEGMTIWSAPFINGWSHGRDPGLMVLGTLADMVEYKFSLHNGEGANTLNQSDELLMGAQMRFFLMGKKENPNTFLHIGFIRSRLNRQKDGGNGEIADGAFLYSPWMREISNEPVQGWRTGVDVGFRYDVDMDKNNLRVELEYMWNRWERNFDDDAPVPDPRGRQAQLIGWGFSFALAYRINMCPEIEGEGIIPTFRFTYSDLDDDHSNGSNTDGQRAWTYTLGLGYAFNKHMALNFNWVLMDIDDKNNFPTKKGNDGSDDWENAWFLQFTFQW